VAVSGFLSNLLRTHLLPSLDPIDAAIVDATLADVASCTPNLPVLLDEVSVADDNVLSMDGMVNGNSRSKITSSRNH
jgi:hypothetical protein